MNKTISKKTVYSDTDSNIYKIGDLYIIDDYTIGTQSLKNKKRR